MFVALPINVMEQETSVPPGRPGATFASSLPEPAGIAAMARLIIAAAANPAIVAGDEIARAGADKSLVKLVDRIGAAVWFEGLRGRNSFPTDHPAWRGTLAFDAPGHRQAARRQRLGADGRRAVLRGVWYAPGSPFPAGCRCCRSDRRRRASPTISRSMPA